MNRLLMPLASAYGWGARQRQRAFRRGWLKSRRLGRPVISVGNLTMGGSGKTPLVILIAEILVRHGYKPAILTRGYGRESGPGLLAIEPQKERSPGARGVGDEPALIAKALPQVPIVICADRYRAGRHAEEHFDVDVHILDDGFQHFALERDLDMVAMDVTQEFSDGAVLPAGRLREPLAALKRADLILLTRVELQDPAALERQVRDLHAGAQIFHSSTALRGLTEAGCHQLTPPGAYRGMPLCAFCGIGNPGAFFADLRRWGYTLQSEKVFRDHHVYSEADIKHLLKIAREVKAAALITTEKDVMNLPSHWKSDIPIFACATQAEICEAEAFEQALLAGLQARKHKAAAAL